MDSENEEVPKNVPGNAEILRGNTWYSELLMTSFRQNGNAIQESQRTLGGTLLGTGVDVLRFYFDRNLSPFPYVSKALEMLH